MVNWILLGITVVIALIWLLNPTGIDTAISDFATGTETAINDPGTIPQTAVDTAGKDLTIPVWLYGLGLLAVML